MVALIPKAKINEFNIDTVERAIVLGAMALRLAIAKSNNNDELRKQVKISLRNRGTRDVNLELDVRLPFAAEDFTLNGGLLLESVAEFATTVNDVEPFLDLNIEPTENNSLVIPDYSERVVSSFEEYFLYYALILSASVSENRNRVITIEPKGEGFNAPEIRVRVYLPLLTDRWAIGKSIIESIDTVATAYPTDEELSFENNEVSLLTDETLLTDEILLVD